MNSATQGVSLPSWLDTPCSRKHGVGLTVIHDMTDYGMNGVGLTMINGANECGENDFPQATCA